MATQLELPNYFVTVMSLLHTDYQLLPYGEKAVLIQFEQQVDPLIHQKVVIALQAIKKAQLPFITSLIPSYCSIVATFNTNTTTKTILAALTTCLEKNESIDSTPTKIVTIPVCYHPQFGIDLGEVAQHTQLTSEEIIQKHTANTYLVYMLGFTPGFPYLGGMDSKLTTPRKQTPRLKVPKGAVGIANNQTGIYPNESPGGWQIIGATPLSLFTPNETPLLTIGDSVRFQEISIEEYNNFHK